MTHQAYLGDGDAILDHLERYLGAFAQALKYEDTLTNRTIQILSFPEVMADCDVLCTFGLTKFGLAAEVYTVAERPYDHLPDLLGNVALLAAERGLHLIRGTHIGGLAAISPEFVNRFQKEALYFTAPHIFPDEFAEIQLPSSKVRLWQAFLITEQEEGLLKRLGWNGFEETLEQAEVDVFTLNRPSFV